MYVRMTQRELMMVILALRYATSQGRYDLRPEYAAMLKRAESFVM